MQRPFRSEASWRPRRLLTYHFMNRARSTSGSIAEQASARRRPLLATLHGDQFASVRIDRFQALPAYMEDLRKEDDWWDMMWTFPGNLHSLRVVLFARAVAGAGRLCTDSFVAPNDPVIGWPPVFRVCRDRCCLEVCIHLVDNSRLRNGKGDYQATLVAGLDLQKVKGERMPFVFLAALSRISADSEPEPLHRGATINSR